MSDSQPPQNPEPTTSEPLVPTATRGRKRGTRNPFPVTVFFDEDVPEDLAVPNGSPEDTESIELVREKLAQITQVVAGHTQLRKELHDEARKKIELQREQAAKDTKLRIEEEERQKRLAKQANLESAQSVANGGEAVVANAGSAVEEGVVQQQNGTNGEGKSLKALMEERQNIPTVRKFNLDGAELSEDEQAIIRARVRIQQLQYAEYERKENQKKVHMIWEVHPNVTEGEALKALEECQGDEDEVIANLTSFTYLRNLRIKIAQEKTPVVEPEKRGKAKTAESNGVHASPAGEKASDDAEAKKGSDSESEARPDDDDEDEDDDLSGSDIDIDEDEDDFGNKYRTRRHKKQKRMTVPKLKLDDAIAKITTENTMEGWSTARKRAWQLKDRNPNAYYYRFNHPGEVQRNGKWTDEEKQQFFRRMEEFGVNGQWGIFSTKIPGRVGYQCANFYRQLIELGEIKDERYKIDGKGKAHFMFKSSAKRGKRKRGDDEEEEEEEEPHFEPPSIVAATTTTTTTTPTYTASGEADSVAAASMAPPPAKRQKKAPAKEKTPKAKATGADKPKKQKKSRAKATGALTTGAQGSPLPPPSLDPMAVEPSPVVTTAPIAKPKVVRKRKKKRKRAEDGDGDDDDGDYRPSSKTAEIVASQMESKQIEIVESNPLLGYIDAITSEQVVQPALSPYGHVLSYNTWIKCLQREPKNTCPFTKKPLKKRDLIALTWDNIAQYRPHLKTLGISLPE